MTVAITLEELISNDDYLVARGTGRLTYDNDRYPFRWRFRYKNVEKEPLDSLWDLLLTKGAGVVLHPAPVLNQLKLLPEYAYEMPLENLDFFDMEERIEEPVRRYACYMLEESAYGGDIRWGQTCSLQPPSVRMRLAFAFMECMDWGCYRGDVKWSSTVGNPSLSADEWRIIDELYEQYYQCCQRLLNGTAESIPTTYLAAYRAFEALTSQLGDDSDSPATESPVFGLEWLLNNASDGWSVGDTREYMYTYHPFEELQGAEESQATKENDEEEASEDDEDELPELDD